MPSWLSRTFEDAWSRSSIIRSGEALLVKSLARAHMLPFLTMNCTSSWEERDGKSQENLEILMGLIEITSQHSYVGATEIAVALISSSV